MYAKLLVAEDEAWGKFVHTKGRWVWTSTNGFSGFILGKGTAILECCFDSVVFDKYHQKGYFWRL